MTLEERVARLEEKCGIKPEVKFPVYRRSKCTNIIVRFDAPMEGEIVMSDNPDEPIGHYGKAWARFDFEDTWEEVPTVTIDGDIFYDTQPVWVWDYDDDDRILRFIDAVNRCTFSSNGSRKGYMWNHYATPKCIDDWMIEWWKELKV